MSSEHVVYIAKLTSRSTPKGPPPPADLTVAMLPLLDTVRTEEEDELRTDIG